MIDEPIIKPTSQKVADLTSVLYSYSDFLGCLYGNSVIREEWGDGRGYRFSFHSDLSRYAGMTMSFRRDGVDVEVDFLTEIVDKLYSRLYFYAPLADQKRWYLMTCEVHDYRVQFAYVTNFYHQGRCDMSIYINGISYVWSKNPMVKHLQYLASVNHRLYLLHSSFDGFPELIDKKTVFKVAIEGVSGWNVSILLYADIYKKLKHVYQKMIDNRHVVPVRESSAGYMLTFARDIELEEELSSKPNQYG